MMKKFHITDDGPKECKANVRSCPIGGNHFESIDEAEDAFHSQNTTFRTLKSRKRRLTDITTVGKVAPMKGGSYFGAAVSDRLLVSYLSELEKELGKEKFTLIEENKVNRDGGYHFHMTVIKPNEVRELKKKNISLNDLPTGEIIIKGIGNISHEGKEAWYAIAESPKLERWRREVLGLGSIDFHITLGFIEGDIHHMSKGQDTLKIY